MIAAAVLDALGRWPGALWLQASGTAYLLVNAAHILGIALLLGGILPLDLRLAFARCAQPWDTLAAAALRTAGAGLALALLTGAWLFTVRPHDYVDNVAFRCKLLLLVFALVNIAAQRLLLRRHGGWTGFGIAPWSLRVPAMLSAALWVGVLVAGRWIGFA